MKTNLEKNKEIAKMLGWVYLSNLDINTGKHHESIKSGWYTKLPKRLILKLTNHLYIGRNHYCLKFDTDWNRLMLAVDFVEKQKYSFWIGKYASSITKEKDNDFLIHIKDSKKEAVFEAIYLFSKQYNNV